MNDRVINQQELAQNMSFYIRTAETKQQKDKLLAADVKFRKQSKTYTEFSDLYKKQYEI